MFAHRSTPLKGLPDQVAVPLPTGGGLVVVEAVELVRVDETPAEVDEALVLEGTELEEARVELLLARVVVEAEVTPGAPGRH